MTAPEFRALRIRAGLSIRDAALELEVWPTTITRWEGGARGIQSWAADELWRIARKGVGKK